MLTGIGGSEGVHCMSLPSETWFTELEFATGGELFTPRTQLSSIPGILMLELLTPLNVRRYV